jgi:hypothetical protein
LVSYFNLVLGVLISLVLVPVPGFELHRFPMNRWLHGPIIPAPAAKRRMILNVVRPSGPLTALFPVKWVAVSQSSGDCLLFIVEQLLFTRKTGEQNSRQFCWQKSHSTFSL